MSNSSWTVKKYTKHLKYDGHFYEPSMLIQVKACGVMEGSEVLRLGIVLERC